MADTVIKVEHLFKEYRLGVINHGSLHKDLQALWARLRGKEDPNSLLVSPHGESLENQDRILALNDINFEVKRGEVLGIIGANGSGKSTLLKILSRVTAPTKGTVKIKGRIGSLLEVGTGFHPELTGRENIFMNGAILGMKRREIAKKLDEIIDFSGIEKFIDTPVKRYSSGMYVRLAFAVAAHLDPEILVVDEVLAVGDAEFQKKCLGKMQDVSGEGRTVLFVSHNMAAVRKLCTRGILLENGEICGLGDIDYVINDYLFKESVVSDVKVDLRRFERRKGNGNGKVLFQEIAFFNKGKPSNKYSIGDDLVFIMTLYSQELVQDIKIAFQLFTSQDIPIGNIVDTDSGFQIDSINGVLKIQVTLSDIRFYPNQYQLGLWVGNVDSVERYDYLERCAVFEVVDGGKLTSRRLPLSAGLLFLTPDWKQIAFSND